MMSPFSFQGQIGRLPYALWSIGLFFSQHLVALMVITAYGAPPHDPQWMFYVMPLRFGTLRGAPDLVLILVLAYALAAAWALAALSFRRAANAGISVWMAAVVIAPVVQIAIILLLCVAPPRASAQDTSGRISPDDNVSPGRGPAATDRRESSDLQWQAAVQGLLAGAGLILAAVALGVLVFGTYGYGLFVVAPFIVGAITAYLANRRNDIGAARTLVLLAGAVALGGVALIAAALEGIVCLVVASPLGLIMAWIGGVLGREIARERRTPRQILPGLAVLPIVFAVENVTAPLARFETTETIAVNAPADRVWTAIVHMDPLDEPPGLPFRLGVAYPMRGEIDGEGAGAIRRGVFSTGVAIERITEWVSERKFAFVVVSDVPGMREISPYEHVHAPHVAGYFLTDGTSFELVPLADGSTRIIEHTSHQLRLDPALYWLPMARFIVHENNARVLAHIKRQAERAVQASSAVTSNVGASR
jgi:uncharacterized membrane protein YhaH (DUF805 family)